MTFKRLADDGTRSLRALAFLDLKALRQERRESAGLAVLEAQRLMGLLP